MAYGFDADRLLVWLAPREADADPLRAGGLCMRHADAMVVPRGWTLDDGREPGPRLFQPGPVEGVPAAAGRRAAGRSGPQRSEQLRLVDGDPAAVPTVEGTVADVAGPSPSDDPDATQAIPWLPGADDDTDLGGVLAAGSPLLARAFRGTDRPRD